VQWKTSKKGGVFERAVPPAGEGVKKEGARI